MTDYIKSPLETDDGDPETLERAAYDHIRSRWPGWNPSANDLMSWGAGALARMTAEARVLAQDVPSTILRYVGSKLHGIAPIDARAAETTAQFSVSTNPAGRTIEAGFLVDIKDAGGETVAFMVSQNTSAGAGVLTIPNVPLVALIAGAAGSGLGAPGVVVSPIDSRDWVTAITLNAATINGADAETPEDYNSRLSAALTLLAPRPILPRDFALMSVDIAAKSGAKVRALALDGYNPVTATFNNDKTIAIYMVDADTGLNVSGAIKTAVSDQLQLQREINFVVLTSDPTSNTVQVTYTAKSVPGAVPADVKTAADQALTDYFARSNWGQPSDVTELRAWRNTDRVRRMEVATVLNGVNGLDYLLTLTIGLNGGAQNTNEENILTGVVPLTSLSSTAGSTVTA